METPLLETMGTEVFCFLSQHRVSRLQSVWCAGQHLETMPRIGWGSQPTEPRQELSQPFPQHTHIHTQAHREKPKLALAKLCFLPHLHVERPAQAKTITAGPWDPDELCDCIATRRLICRSPDSHPSGTRLYLGVTQLLPMESSKLCESAGAKETRRFSMDSLEFLCGTDLCWEAGWRDKRPTRVGRTLGWVGKDLGGAR